MIGQDYKNHVLFDFNSIIDTDIGVAMVMNDKYNNPSIVNEKMMGKSIDDYKFLMLNRKYYNPVIMFLQNDYRLSADELYIEMMNNDDVYNEILNRSITTSLYDVLKASQQQSSLPVTVLCWNKNQQEFMKKFDNSVDTILHEEDKTVNIHNYDTLVIKFPYNPVAFDNSDPDSENGEDESKLISGKNIYICRYRCNMKPEDINALNPNDAVKFYHLNANEIYVIDVYGDVKLDDAIKYEYGGDINE